MVPNCYCEFVGKFREKEKKNQDLYTENDKLGGHLQKKKMIIRFGRLGM